MSQNVPLQDGRYRIHTVHLPGVADLGLSCELGRAQGEAEERARKCVPERAAEEDKGLELVRELRQQVGLRETDLDACSPQHQHEPSVNEWGVLARKGDAPGCCVVAPGRYLVWGSKMTRLSPDTNIGRSVAWYVLLKPSPKRPVDTTCTHTGNRRHRICHRVLAFIWQTVF